MRTPLLAALLCAAVVECHAAEPITHSLFIAGAETKIIDGAGKELWRYPAATRDGFVLPNGNLLLAVSKNKDYPGGAVVEITRENKVVFEWKGTQAEVNTAQRLENGNTMLTEAGAKPRIVEVDPAGKIVVEVALQCQTANAHMESRMARKLANGNYLVPQLLDKVVREYAPDGRVVWEFKTPEEPKDSWPFTAIRLPNGNTFVNLTHGNHSVEVDPAGKIVWHVTNADLPETPLKDPCGAQVLPNGHVVIGSYAARGEAVKMVELDRDKKVVWSFKDGGPAGIHEFQVLDTNGVPLEGRPMK